MIIGIDLGTTNSACAVWRDGQTETIPNGLGDTLTPSVVGIDDDGTVLVGQAARQRLVSHPDRTVAFFKRLMGTSKMVSLGGSHQFTPVELSSLVVRSLKEDAERYLGEPVAQAVISVPAYFNDLQRQATRDAAELAGLTVSRLINEPTAAAMAHGLHEASEQRFMILDLGGGTFDVSIIEYFEGVIEVHATAGDWSLGGEDFTEALLQYFVKESGIDNAQLSAGDRQRLYARIETFKRQFGGDRDSEIRFTLNDQDFALEVDTKEFEAATASLLRRLRVPMERSLKDANLRRDQLDDVVLVGGASRMQVFRSMVARLFGRLPRTDSDPDLTIVMGAAIQAGLASRDASLDDVVLTDVCPYSLGIAVVNQESNAEDDLLFSPILERNTIVPVSKAEDFFTVADKQKEIRVQIFQGESRWVRNNVFMGDLSVKVPSAPAGEQSIQVRFSYDANALLAVDVEVKSTGKKISRVIESAAGRLTDAQKQASLKRLEKLKVLPRDREEVRTVLARADRVYASLLGDDRHHLSMALSAFEKTLQGQNPTEIERACRQLNELLDEIDTDIWS